MTEHSETNGSVECTANTPNEERCETMNEANNSESAILTELERKIIRQIEYYFGDINLSRDKFLQEQIKLEDGWVHLETMMKFNRLASLSKDGTVISNALAKSESGLMEISEDKLKIRRSPNKPLVEMNEERRKELMDRTIYCKGFPKEGTNIDKLLDFFVKYSKVENVVMRNYRDKATKTWHFKGSIFVVFPTQESADSFVKLESVKFEDTELIKMKQSDYIDMKRKERLEGKKKAAQKVEEDEKKKAEEEEVKKEKEEKRTRVPSGCIVKLKAGIPPGVLRDAIKKKIEDYGFSVAFVDLRKNEEGGWVRLDEQDSAKYLVAKLEEEGRKLKLEGGEEVEVEMPTEEEESAYAEKVKAILSKKFQGYERGGGRRRGGGRNDRGGRGRGGWSSRKRKGGSFFEGGGGPTPAKVKAEVKAEAISD